MSCRDLEVSIGIPNELFPLLEPLLHQEGVSDDVKEFINTVLWAFRLHYYGGQISLVLKDFRPEYLRPHVQNLLTGRKRPHTDSPDSPDAPDAKRTLDSDFH